MKSKMALILILALLNLWIPAASAEISRDLDPMVPADVQATVTGETSAAGVTDSQASNVVSAADAVSAEKKVEGTTKEASKKSSKKKSSKKKSSEKKSSKKSKSSKSKSGKKHKKSGSN